MVVLPDNHHGENAKGDSKIERNRDHTVAEGLFGCENKVLGEQIDDDRETAGNQRCNKPGRNNSGDSLTFIPSPRRSLPAQSGNTPADDGADD